MPKEWSRPGKGRRQYVKSQFAKLAGGGDFVSDAEKRGMDKEKQQAVSQTLGAQQKMLERSAMAQTGGSPLVAGAMRGASADIGKTGAEQAVKITGENQRFVQALRDKRGAEALAMGERLHESQKASAAKAVEFGLKAVEVAAGIAGLGGYGPE